MLGVSSDFYRYISSAKMLSMIKIWHIAQILFSTTNLFETSFLLMMYIQIIHLGLSFHETVPLTGYAPKLFALYNFEKEYLLSLAV